MNRILFIYGQDFKEKSIQVLKKTPEAYVKNGFEVHILIARDNSPKGSYFYEKELNIPGATTDRIYWPLQTFRGNIKNNIIRTILNKLVGFFIIARLAISAKRKIKNHNFQCIYGYELHGVLASLFTRMFVKTNAITVSRFMGTWLGKHIKERNFINLILNFDFLLSFKVKSDLCIMTNDGTEGDYAFNWCNGKTSRFEFLLNGVDKAQSTSENPINQEVKFISLSRLNDWKRVDRVINVFSEYNKLNPHSSLTIVGGGPEEAKLKILIKNLCLNNVMFTGPVTNIEAHKLLESHHIFLSFYELSNLGNPLLEAIRRQLVIVTLNNGATGSLIENDYPLLFQEDSFTPKRVASSIHTTIDNVDTFNSTKARVSDLNSKLMTWEERLQYEVNIIKELIRKNENH